MVQGSFSSGPCCSKMACPAELSIIGETNEGVKRVSKYSARPNSTSFDDHPRVDFQRIPKFCPKKHYLKVLVYLLTRFIHYLIQIREDFLSFRFILENHGPKV